MTGQRSIAATHEAGHAVAACMRGGSLLRSVHLGQTHGTGLTILRGKVWDQPFFTWAGCWAEARLAWGAKPVELPYLRYDNADGVDWDDTLTGVFLSQPDDAEMVGVVDPRTEAVWCLEMERAWPTVQTVADRLLAEGKITSRFVVRELDLADDALGSDS